MASSSNNKSQVSNSLNNAITALNSLRSVLVGTESEVSLCTFLFNELALINLLDTVGDRQDEWRN